MRITTQMLNESARKAGVPIHTTSMLSYALNREKTNALPFERNMGSGIESSRKNKIYEKQEDAAKHLTSVAEELAGKGEKSIYDREDTPENKEALEKKVTELVKQYNELLSSFQDNGDLLDSFYKKNLKSLIEENEKQLKAIGVTADKNGKLLIDERKLSAADRNAVKEAFAGKEGFAESLSFLSEKIADYAASNRTSAGNLYSQDGSEADALRYMKNRYDAWG